MKSKKSIFYKLGLTLIIVSMLLWITPVVVPFIPISVKARTGIITVALIVSEILFWTGVLLAGREVAKKIRGYINPKNWRKKQPSEEGSHKEE
ncbi:transporter suffix domain-containing protein [Cohnella abietis]|uniref:Transporter suffix domain-containing protein n=1 Tax=Cohnella abietis TaxID=2507935 RepID=A0A3T1CYR6_9BACL|nr:transporter suffix domain-containing protein [Cohnella abietis]BBI30951.1 hypothetical protein KCTCHS21_03500 [Cohnella abietis]